MFSSPICSAFFLSRSVYKDHQCFDSDPASGQRSDKELVTQTVLITASIDTIWTFNPRRSQPDLQPFEPVVVTRSSAASWLCGHDQFMNIRTTNSVFTGTLVKGITESGSQCIRDDFCRTEDRLGVKRTTALGGS
jgi:hypothetical protein